MSYSTDPVKDADRHYGPIYAAQERMEEAREMAAGEFQDACRKCDANALATFAPMVPDYAKYGSMFAIKGLQTPRRYQTLAEVMRDTSKGIHTELMQILLNLVYGDEPKDVTACRAEHFLEDLYRKYAVETVERDYGE